MQMGLGILKLSPRDFWAMTPKELALAITGLTGLQENANLSRADFNTLLQRFPDEELNG